MAQEKRLTTPRGRLSFPFLFKPRPAEKPGDKEKYSLSLIFDADAQKTPEWKAIVQEVRDMALTKFGAKQPDGTVAVPKGVRNPIRDGAEKVRDDGTPMDGYGPGTKFISATSELPPGVIGGDLKPCSEKDVFAGCYVRATVTVYSYDRKDGRGVTFGLRNVQHLATGKAFGGGGDPAKDFAATPGYARTGSSADFASGASPTDDEAIPF